MASLLSPAHAHRLNNELKWEFTVVVEELGDQVHVGQHHSSAAEPLQTEVVECLATICLSETRLKRESE
jgi:hypothetical protein